MHLQDITNMLNLQEIIITNFIYGFEDKIYITVEPIEYTQTCQCCESFKVIKCSLADIRKIKNLSIF